MTPETFRRMLADVMRDYYNERDLCDDSNFIDFMEWLAPYQTQTTDSLMRRKKP